jgi:hypothetical protein
MRPTDSTISILPIRLARLVEVKRGPYAMAWVLHDGELQAGNDSPGLIDHREWTPTTTATMRSINGFGAPRAFDTAVLRGINFQRQLANRCGLRFPRIPIAGFTTHLSLPPLEGNSDSARFPETANRYDLYKDGVRTEKSSLVSGVDRLLESQTVAWPALDRGLQGLRESQTRVERVFGRDVLVRHIPHRIKAPVIHSVSAILFLSDASIGRRVPLTKNSPSPQASSQSWNAI